MRREGAGLGPAGAEPRRRSDRTRSSGRRGAATTRKSRPCSRSRSPPPDASKRRLTNCGKRPQDVRPFRRPFANMPVSLLKLGRSRRSHRGDREPALRSRPTRSIFRSTSRGFISTSNDRVKARMILSQALAAAPGRPDILAVLARVMLLDGDYAAAADMFRHLLALRPDDAMTRADLGCLPIGNGRTRRRRSDAARSDPRQAGDAWPRDPSAGRDVARPFLLSAKRRRKISRRLGLENSGRSRARFSSGTAAGNSRVHA